jgi:hypothetical protein
MDPRQLFLDERFAGVCVYCGGAETTADHVPSRVLLDEPYPDNLPVVRACDACNNRFSLDEPYVACLIECALCGSVDPGSVCRSKVKRILTARPDLASLIGSCRREDASGSVWWEVDLDRVRSVVLKLAQGHAAYEGGEPMLGEPRAVFFLPIEAIPADQLRSFESLPVRTDWPEIGSRAFLQAVKDFPRAVPGGDWQVVQPGRYRYLVSHSGGITVRFVLTEYLACEANW